MKGKFLLLILPKQFTVKGPDYSVSIQNVPEKKITEDFSGEKEFQIYNFLHSGVYVGTTSPNLSTDRESMGMTYFVI